MGSSPAPALTNGWMSQFYGKIQGDSSLYSRFMDDKEIEESEKVKRLKTEVRYCRDTSLSLPRCSDIFRMKRDNKPLPCKEYATNLSIYLDKVQSNTSVTMQDFIEVLETMMSD